MSMPAAITPQPVNATLSKRPELEYNKFETVAEPSKRFSTLSTTRNGVGAGDLLVSPPPPVDEGPSPFVQEGVQRKHLKSATVTYLDGTKHAFYVHKNSEGEILFDMVAFQLNLNEKDYFGLFFTNQDTMHWLYKDKKIFKQLKNLPWNFFFAVKFYPTHPSQLAEDLTRYLLFQQLRQDVHNEKLPVSFVSQAKLGSLAAQAEFGDFEASSEYLSYLKNAKIARTVSEPLLEKVEELHKQNKGQTSPEAELNYLNECKDLALYGVWLFQAKDSKGKPVQIGVSAQGISVYNDQMRIHRFAWVNIIKFSYRRNAFTIKLKPGEMDKKDTSVTYKLGDYPSAKRLWKSAVEHHTFFRLIQPEAKQKTSLLSFGSNKFRYQGRTNIQSHMASQLFDGTGAAVERADSVRLTSKSADNITPKVPKEHTSPLHYADDGSRDHVTKSKSTKKEKKNLGHENDSSSSSSSSSSDVEVVVKEGKQRKEKTHHIQESSLPRKTVHSWEESSAGPETVTTEVDEDGNIVKRTTVKSEQVKHTVQMQSYQTYALGDDQNSTMPMPAPRTLATSSSSNNGTELNGSSAITSPTTETRIRTMAYEHGDGDVKPLVASIGLNGDSEDPERGQLVSTKAVTTGNRTVETLTYKKEKDGVIETHVEHRITIHSGEEIDHDAELSRAILEATNMNPEMTVEKVELKHERQ